MNKLVSEIKVALYNQKHLSYGIIRCKWELNGSYRFSSALFDLDEVRSRLGPSVLREKGKVVYKTLTNDIVIGELQIEGLYSGKYNSCPNCLFEFSGIKCSDIAPCYFHPEDISSSKIDVSMYPRINRLAYINKISLFISSYMNRIAELIIIDKE